MSWFVFWIVGLVLLSPLVVAAPLLSIQSNFLGVVISNLFGRQIACFSEGGIQCTPYPGLPYTDPNACCSDLNVSGSEFCCSSDPSGCCPLPLSVSTPVVPSFTPSTPAIVNTPTPAPITPDPTPSPPALLSTSITILPLTSSSTTLPLKVSFTTSPLTSSYITLPLTSHFPTPQSPQLPQPNDGSTSLYTYTRSPGPTTQRHATNSLPGQTIIPSRSLTPGSAVSPGPSVTSDVTKGLPTQDASLPSSTTVYTRPAFIGGITAGFIVIIIILGVLVWHCCCRAKVKVKRTKRSSKREHKTQNLNIGVSTAREWQNLYLAEAVRIEAGVNEGKISPERRVQLMEDFSIAALETRWRETGINPSDALPVKVAEILIAAFGMSETEDVTFLSQNACSTSGHPWLADYLAEVSSGRFRFLWHEVVLDFWVKNNLSLSLMNEVANYIEAYVAAQAGSKLIHLKPTGSQLYVVARNLIDNNANMSEALLSNTKAMALTLDFMFGAAIDVHRKVFIVNALSRALHVSTEGKKSGIYVDQIEMGHSS